MKMNIIGLSVDFQKKDVRGYKFENCSLVTSIFTLQFMPRKDRFDVLQNIYNGLNHGGAFLSSQQKKQFVMIQDYKK